jgi:beta-glucosidase
MALLSAAMAERRFPDGFTWGTATAAHQVEGQNWNNDWWMWEHDSASSCEEPSGDACDQYHLFERDIALMAQLGLDNYRFSIEWSRIEPEEGEFSIAALDHYRRVCAACLAHGIEPVVTYHHFTNPRWFAATGGWESEVAADRFARFCERASGHLGDLVARSCTINEPNIVAFIGYRLGFFPPGVTDADRFRVVRDHFIEAHRQAYDAIKSGPGAGPVGLTLSMADFQAAGDGTPDGDERAQVARDRARRAMEDRYLEAVRGDDFIGVQTYTRDRIGPDGQPRGPEAGVELTQMNYEFWPEALGATVRRAWEVTVQLPVIVTENGYSGVDDTRRVEYVRRALTSILDCIDDGVDVRGYTYWSLLDTFVWAYGYRPRFGIVSVDRSTQERTVKPSARYLGAIARANALAD